MNEPEDEFTDAEIEAMLAELAVHEPIPEQVSVRLEETLAGLHAETATGHAPESARKVRRVGPLLLLAAAASAVAVGSGGVLQQITGNSSTAGGSAKSTSDQAPQSAADSAEVAPGPSSRVAGTVVTLRSNRLGTDIKAAMSLQPRAASSLTGGAAQACNPPAEQPKERFRAPATLDDEPATLVVLRRQGGLVGVVWDCSGTQQLRQVRIAR